LIAGAFWPVIHVYPLLGVDVWPNRDVIEELGLTLKRGVL
jgi:hypothetical protein